MHKPRGTVRRGLAAAAASGMVLLAAACGPAGEPSGGVSGVPSPSASPSPSVATTIAGTPEPDATTPATPAAGATESVAAVPPAPSSPAVGLSPVDVILSYGLWDEAAQQVQVAGYASLVEQGGTCTLVLSSADGTAQSSASALPDATTTSCGMVAVDAADLPGQGPWNVVLRYVSSTSSGESTPVTIGRG